MYDDLQKSFVTLHRFALYRNNAFEMFVREVIMMNGGTELQTFPGATGNRNSQQVILSNVRVVRSVIPEDFILTGNDARPLPASSYEKLQKIKI